ncbi:MAG: hypothetical protein INR64_17375 [Caulobacteraceae bacterium]|nr:hypothetical protein [Caulobacter sp.]
MWPFAHIESAMSPIATVARPGVDVGRLRQGSKSTIVDFGKAGCRGRATRLETAAGLDKPQGFGQNT